MRELFPPEIHLPGCRIRHCRGGLRGRDDDLAVRGRRCPCQPVRRSARWRGGNLLDGCIGIAGVVRSGGILAMPLAEINVSYVRPVPSGTAIGKGAVVRLGRKVGFVEGTLFDLNGGGACVWLRDRSPDAVSGCSDGRLNPSPSMPQIAGSVTQLRGSYVKPRELLSGGVFGVGQKAAVDDIGESSLEGANGFHRCCRASSDARGTLRRWVTSTLCHRDAMDRGVQLAVAGA